MGDARSRRTGAPAARDHARRCSSAYSAIRSTEKQVRADIAHEIRRRGGAHNIVVYEYTDKSLYGKPLQRDRGRRGNSDPVDAAIRIQMEGLDRPGGARMRGFSMAEWDMEHIAKQEWVATSTDGGHRAARGRAVDSRPVLRQLHAQNQLLRDRARRDYAGARRSRGDTLPARIMRLKDRGAIREGMAADIVVFDVQRIRDKATFFEPHQHSEGIEQVFVNGVARVRDGRLVDALPGRVLTRTAR